MIMVKQTKNKIVEYNGHGCNGFVSRTSMSSSLKSNIIASCCQIFPPQSLLDDMFDTS